MTRSTRTRRTALKLIGATAAVTGATSVVTAQETEGDHDDHGHSDEGEDEGADRQPIILAGRTEYWYGIAPQEIEGEENPTLNLEDGQEYDLVWINVDGAEHELIIESEDGEELEESDSSEMAGEAVSMTFEASEDAAEYFCEYHPEAMRGDVEFDDGFDLSPQEGNDEDGNGTENETEQESGNETTDSETGY
ncbi:plastocyanin/azurin family copper-binding protein [Natrinema sp. SYSU A 869]|uniref:cupredoxin domain-containing protein n=1 Tax=Natrinema sp. SYSU A 869 TaxID=2871694 RepID=UPI001CA42255|nr:plastocyanin/azurin family copper-binding protein [Natrinema sp. SYSU A 869]